MVKFYKIFAACLISFSMLCGCSTFSQSKNEETSVSNLPTTTPSNMNKIAVKSKIKKANKITIAMNAPTTLNPLSNTEENAQQALYLIFSPLVNIEENGTISANIASSWILNENNTVLTLSLNDTIRWHDGKPVTTDDVIFTMDQIKKLNDCPYRKAIENIASIQKIDDSTMKILYKQPFSGVLQTLFFPVIPKHIYNVPDNNSLNIIPIGSGPYRFKSMTPLKNIQLEANTDYFRGAPKIQQVEISIIPDEESSLHAFKQNLIDVVYTDITEWGKYTNDKSSKAYELTANTYEFLGLNFNNIMFQNNNIRKALINALDREKIVHLYYLDHAVITDTPISPASYLFDNSLKEQTYDKEKAKLLLTQEGYVLNEKTHLMTKNDMPFSFTLLVNAENKDRVKIAGEIKRMYKEIGIDANVEIVSKEAYLSRIQSKQYDAFLGGWQLSYATDLSFALHSNKIINGQNFASYKNPKMDELLQQTFLASQSQLEAYYKEVQQLFIEDVPYVSLFFKKKVLITKDYIAGNIKPLPLNIFANVEEWVLE